MWYYVVLVRCVWVGRFFYSICKEIAVFLLYLCRGVAVETRTCLIFYLKKSLFGQLHLAPKEYYLTTQYSIKLWSAIILITFSLYYYWLKQYRSIKRVWESYISRRNIENPVCLDCVQSVPGFQPWRFWSVVYLPAVEFFVTSKIYSSIIFLFIGLHAA